MKLRQIAEELTDDLKKEYSKGFEYNKEESGYGYHRYSFEVGDAKFIAEIAGADCPGGQNCRVHDVSFEDVTDGRFSDNRQGITGRGNVKEVFSTMVEIIKDFLSKNPNEALIFSGDEGSRDALYSRFGRSASRIFPGYVGIVSESNDGHVFIVPKSKSDFYLNYANTSGNIGRRKYVLYK
jgi:hypothetical protein